MSKQNILRDGIEEFFQILRKDKKDWGSFYLDTYVGIWKEFFENYFREMKLSENEVTRCICSYDRPFLESLRTILKPSSKRFVKGNVAKMISSNFMNKVPDFVVFLFCGLAKRGIVEVKINGKRTIGVDVCWYWKEGRFGRIGKDILKSILFS